MDLSSAGHCLACRYRHKHLALHTDLEPKQQNYIRKGNRSAEALLGIINDILDFSKIEAGMLNMEKIDFRLEDVFDNLANLIW